jgi:hypothetical protein
MKKIAFVKNGIVGVVLNTDDELHDCFLNSDLRIDISEHSEKINTGWFYNNGRFTEEK